MAEFVYNRFRSEFGRQCSFADRGIELDIDIQPDESENRNYIRRDPCDRCVGETIDMSECYVNSPYQEYANQGINHVEGGWPKDVNCAEPEQTTRHRKKMEKEEFYAAQMMNMMSVMEHGIMQNNAVNLYNTFFDDCTMLNAADMIPPNVKIISTYKDPSSIKRSVTSIDWHPEGSDRFVVAHSIVKFQHHTPDTSLDFYVYRTEEITKPELTLASNFPTCAVRYSTKDTNIIIGGQYNGQVAYWDIRKGSGAVDRSELHLSHREPAYKVVWVASKSGYEFFSTSTDGQVIWWDMRKIAVPLDQMWIDPTKKQDPAYAEGGLCLDYESTMPAKFLVSTESGRVFVCNRKAKSAGDRVSGIFETHIGPVYSVQRNPIYPKYFLTMGDWTTKIWTEEVKDSAIWWTAPSTEYSTDACWSVTRPSVFFETKMNGSLEVWDMSFNQKYPTLNVFVAEDPLMTLEPEQHGSLIAVGTEKGNTIILRLSESLVDSPSNEKNNFLMALERETRREKIMEGKAREKKLAQKLRPSVLEMERAAYFSDIVKEVEEAGVDYSETVAKDRKKIQRDTLLSRGLAVPVEEVAEVVKQAVQEDGEHEKEHHEGEHRDGHEEGEHKDERKGADEAGEHQEGEHVEGEQKEEQKDGEHKEELPEGEHTDERKDADGAGEHQEGEHVEGEQKEEQNDGEQKEEHHEGEQKEEHTEGEQKEEHTEGEQKEEHTEGEHLEGEHNDDQKEDEHHDG